MAETTINGVFAVELPEGFHVMDEEEMKRIYSGQSPDRWCIRNADTGMTISVMWGKMGLLMSKLVSLKATAGQTQQMMAQRLHDFRLGDSVTPDIAGQKSEGFYYEYTGDGPCEGEWVVTRYQKYAYTISYYAKSEAVSGGRAIFEGFLRAIHV